jgi:hypothetical protein
VSGDGVEIAAVYQLLREVANTVVSHDERLKDPRAEMAALRTDVDGLRKEVRSDNASLRQTSTEYHASVLGHGILISELQRRVLRIEDHLNLPHVV